MKKFMLSLAILVTVFLTMGVTDGFAAAGDPVLNPVLITELEATDVVGNTGTLLSGTAGTNTYAAVWDADNNLVDGPGVPAIIDLSNIASTAIPVSLISDTAATDDLGTEALYWQTLYLDSNISFEGATDDEFQTSFVVTDPTTPDKTITIPNSDETIGVATSAAADAIDAITEVAAALKTGDDGKFVTGTAAVSGNLAAWNGDGDLVDGGTVAPASFGAFTAIEAAGGIATIGLSNFIDLDGEGSAADDITELAGSGVGDVVVLMNSHAAYTMSIKDGTYMLLQGDFDLDDIGDTITLICTIAGANETYAELSRSSAADGS